MIVGYDSYTDIAFFNENILNPDAIAIWGTYDDSTKEAYIKYATKLFDNFGWVGKKCDSISQKLEYPRVYDEYFGMDRFQRLTTETSEFITQAEGVITDEVKLAVVAILEDILSTQGNKSLIQLQEIDVESFNAGSLEFVFKKDRKKNEILYPRIEAVIIRSMIYYLSKAFWRAKSLILERA